MSIICIICARKGSKGLLNKNIKLLNKITLLAHTIIQAKKSKLFENIVVSTDSKHIKNISTRYGAECFFLRPKKLAKDTSPKIPVIQHALIKSENYYKKKFNIIVDLDPTSPLRNINDIRESLKKFMSGNYSNLVTGCKSSKNPYFNMFEIYKNKKIKIVKKSNIELTRRQDAPEVFDMNASIYIWKRNSLLYDKNLINNKTTYYEMPRNRSIDIDSDFDWKIVKNIMKKK